MNFKTYRIADVIDEIAMGPFGSDIKVECFVSSGIPVLNGSNLGGVKLQEDSFRFVTEQKADQLKNANARKGDIVITHRGTLGQISYIPDDAKYDRYVISQSQFRVRCNHLVTPEYLVFYFHTREGQAKLLANTSQVGVPALSRPTSTFREIEVDIPDVPEQKRVCETMNSLCDKIELNNRIIANLEAQAQAIFKNWFVDFEPFNGEAPAGWSVTTLDSLCSLVSRGITPRYSDDANQIVINQKCIRSHKIDLGESRSHTLVAKNEKWLQYGDIVINSTGQGTLGRVAQVFFSLDNITADSHVTIVRPKRRNLNSYLGQWIIFKEAEIESMASGSTGQTELSRERVKAMTLFEPDDSALDAFASIVEAMTEMIQKKQEENASLAFTRDSLLPKLMSGEIEVPVEE